MERGQGLSAAIDPRQVAETVAVFAPGGYEQDPGRLVRARAWFERRGHRFVEALGTGPFERFSASDDQRLVQLGRLVGDPEIAIAIALRGGYGSTRLLPRIDFGAMAEAIRRRGLRFVGHSDFTAIELALLARTGAISFAGPMIGPDFGAEEVDASTEDWFWQAMRDHAVDAGFATDAPDLAASGILWGGNLAMVASLVGTPWMPAIAGGILFIEDVNEHPYRIERMLLQLQQSGVLDAQQVVLCGAFSAYRTTAYDNGYDIATALGQVRAATRTPIVTGLPFGHVATKLTLAVGATAEVRIESGRCRISQRWNLADC